MSAQLSFTVRPGSQGGAPRVADLALDVQLGTLSVKVVEGPMQGLCNLFLSVFSAGITSGVEREINGLASASAERIRMQIEAAAALMSSAVGKTAEGKTARRAAFLSALPAEASPQARQGGEGSADREEEEEGDEQGFCDEEEQEEQEEEQAAARSRRRREAFLAMGEGGEAEGGHVPVMLGAQHAQAA